MRSQLILVCFFFCLSFFLVPVVAKTSARSSSSSDTATVIYAHVPRDRQLFPRDVKTNQAEVVVSGRVHTAGVQRIVIRIFEGEASTVGSCQQGTDVYDEVTQTLMYDEQNTADFSLSFLLEARLINYQVEICLDDGSEEQLERTIEDIVAGDVLLIQGQSNANARKREGSTTANDNQSPYVRSFGRRASSFNPSDDNANGIPDTADELLTDRNWYLAEGDQDNGSGAVGQWGLRLGRLIVDQIGVPVAILNNAVSSTNIEQHQRNDNDPENVTEFHTGGIYGRLLWRSREAGVMTHARALIWFQGESDVGNAATYKSSFMELYRDWMEDYAGLEHVYVHQIRNTAELCGHDPLLREVQRQLGDEPGLLKIRIMSTTGIDPQIDGCHFPYIDGHQKIAENVFRLIAADLYGQTNLSSVEPPNPAFAYFEDDERSTVVVSMRNQGDSLYWNTGTDPATGPEADFGFSNGSLAAVSGWAETGSIHLVLNQAAGDGVRMHYFGHSGVNPPDVDVRAGDWIVNENGVGLLAFYDLPVALDLPSIFLSATQVGTGTASLQIPRLQSVLFEISSQDIDGIKEVKLEVDSSTIFSRTYETNQPSDLTESIEWSSSELGSHVMIAKVVDLRGARNQSLPLAITIINGKPTVEIESPLPESTFVTGSSSIDLKANAEDVDGAVAEVRFHLDGQLILTRKSSPWEASIPSPSSGEHFLVAQAEDNEGAIAQSEPVRIIVVDATPTPLPTSTSTPLPTSTQTSTPVATSTDTPTATATYTPMATLTPAPTVVGTEQRMPIYLPLINGAP